MGKRGAKAKAEPARQPAEKAGRRPRREPASKASGAKDGDEELPLVLAAESTAKGSLGAAFAAGAMASKDDVKRARGDDDDDGGARGATGPPVSKKRATTEEQLLSQGSEPWNQLLTGTRATRASRSRRATPQSRMASSRLRWRTRRSPGLLLLRRSSLSQCAHIKKGRLSRIGTNALSLRGQSHSRFSE